MRLSASIEVKSSRSRRWPSSTGKRHGWPVLSWLTVKRRRTLFCRKGATERDSSYRSIFLDRLRFQRECGATERSACSGLACCALDWHRGRRRKRGSSRSSPTVSQWRSLLSNPALKLFGKVAWEKGFAPALSLLP